MSDSSANGALPGAITITLAGNDYEVPALNLGQIEELADVLFSDTPAGTKSFQRTIAIIATALKVSGRAEMTETMLRGMRITPQEMRAAQAKILEHSGLVRTGEAEAPAKTGAESTGPSSTAA